MSGNDQESQGPDHAGQYITDVMNSFSSHIYTVHLQDFVALVQESRLVRCPSFHYPPNYNGFAVVPDSRTLESARVI